MNGRYFLTDTVASSAVAAAAVPPSGIIDCQSHLFFPEVIEMMRKRKTEPLVYDDKAMAILKMGDWLRKVPPFYLDVETKLAAMDANGIEITMLSNDDPGPEWCLARRGRGHEDAGVERLSAHSACVLEG